MSHNARNNIYLRGKHKENQSKISYTRCLVPLQIHLGAVHPQLIKGGPFHP